MSDPFKIIEPTVISFSGGRTSAYMLWRILQSNNGLPSDALVCFANTGKEAEQTLEFVRDCESNWKIEIHWLEYISEKPKFKRVNFYSASRNGEPFETMIQDKGMMIPNNFMRFCTQELKINTIRRYLKSLDLDIDDDSHLVGIRADEPRRIAKVGINMCPLARDGITAAHIKEFWENNSFDLKLPKVGQNKLSNCDLCFMKGDATLASLIRDNPSRATWWINIEKRAAEALKNKGKSFVPSFRKNSMSYEDMLNNSQKQIDMFSDNSMSCFCGD